MLLCRTCTSCPVSNSQPNPESWQRPTGGHHLPHEVITGQRRAISCGEITRAILVSMIAQTYCIFCTIIILKIHTGGKPRQCLLALMLRPYNGTHSVFVVSLLHRRVGNPAKRSFSHIRRQNAVKRLL